MIEVEEVNAVAPAEWQRIFAFVGIVKCRVESSEEARHSKVGLARPKIASGIDERRTRRGCQKISAPEIAVEKRGRLGDGGKKFFEARYQKFDRRSERGIDCASIAPETHKREKSAFREKFRECAFPVVDLRQPADEIVAVMAESV